MIIKRIFFRSFIGLILTVYLSVNVYAGPDSFSPIVKSEKGKVVHISILSSTGPLQKSKNPLFERFDSQAPPEKKMGAGIRFCCEL